MKESQPLYIDNKTVDNAVTLWRTGGVVAIPTETVYGLAADACNDLAVASIYAVKSRPQFNPLIVHVSDVAMGQRYAEWNPMAEKLAARFWPGALTLVLKRRADCPLSALVSAGGETVAIRMPNHPIALELIRAFNGGIAAPSANRSGRISPTTAAHVKEELGELIPLIIDGGTCDVGLESTVIDVTSDVPHLLRPGAITRPMLAEVLGVAIADADGRKGILSPGQLLSHYAPSLTVRLNADTVQTGEALLAFGASVPEGARTIRNLSPTCNLTEAAANLFRYLRELDTPEHAAIAVMPIPNEGVGEAINDRLTRAAYPIR